MHRKTHNLEFLTCLSKKKRQKVMMITVKKNLRLYLRKKNKFQENQKDFCECNFLSNVLTIFRKKCITQKLLDLRIRHLHTYRFINPKINRVLH